MRLGITMGRHIMMVVRGQVDWVVMHVGKSNTLQGTYKTTHFPNPLPLAPSLLLPSQVRDAPSDIAMDHAKEGSQSGCVDPCTSALRSTHPSKCTKKHSRLSTNVHCDLALLCGSIWKFMGRSVNYAPVSIIPCNNVRWPNRIGLPPTYARPHPYSTHDVHSTH